MSKSFYVGEEFNFSIRGVSYVARIEEDLDHGAPWIEEEGHGEVSDFERRDKAPGELVLCGDGRGRLGTDSARRFYDFAGTCKIARREGWGFLPAPLKTEKLRNGFWRASSSPKGQAPFVAHSRDINRAIRAVYDQHRATMTARQYAAGAALSDFERLRPVVRRRLAVCRSRCSGRLL